MNDSNVPLVVDLDGTLIKTDILLETASEKLLSSPRHIFVIFIYMLRSKSRLKEFLAQRSKLDPSLLPYNIQVLDWLRQQRKDGRSIILATASHISQANKIADYLGIFDCVYATEGSINLKSVEKSALLKRVYGEKLFDYIGNSRADIPVWRCARNAYVVNSSDFLISRIKSMGIRVTQISTEQPKFFASIIKLLRPHQWIKNILLFVPLLASHQFTNHSSILNAVVAFIAFCLVASSAYVLNDIADLAADRHHFRKMHRPFAAGNLSLVVGWLMWPILLFFSCSIAWSLLPLSFLGMLVVYFICTIAYSLLIKKIAIFDVLTLAALYTIRIVSGAIAIEVPLSFWLLNFSIFIFISLAFIKRLNELKSARSLKLKGKIIGRGYIEQDLELIVSMGTASGYISVLVMGLYIQDLHATNLYSCPQAMWLACPILLFWISRAWLIAHRGAMHDDPIVFAIRDKTSWLTTLLIFLIFLFAWIY